MFGTSRARAQGVPPGCSGSAIGISLFTSAPDVHIGDTLFYSVSVFNGIAGNPTSCDASNIVAWLTTPDGVVHPIALRRTYLSHTQSDFYSNIVSYVVRAQDIRPDGTVRATAEDTAVIFQNDTPSNGGANQGVNTEVSQPCIQVFAQCVGGVGENGLITFTGVVTNCGNNTLVGVTVTNHVTGGGSFRVAFVTNLLRGQSATFSGSYVPANPCGANTAVLVAQGVDQFTASPRTVTASSAIICGNTTTPGIRVTKSCPAQPVAPGQLLVFSGTVSNTGNVTLTNIIVRNDRPAANTVVFTLATLAPGQIVSFTGSYLAPTNCSVSDTLTASATSTCGVAVGSTASATCPILTTPQLLVTALCSANPITPGGLVTYGGTVRNTGNVTLTNVVVVSDRPSPNTVVFSGTLAPGAAGAFNATYAVPFGVCSITTAFRGTGSSTCTGAATTNAVSTTCNITTAPAIAVTLVCPVTPAAAGSLITYSGTVRNSGNVTLNNIVVANSQPAPNTVVLTVASLAPGATANFTASFTTPTNVCSVSSLVTARGSDNCTSVVVSNSAAATCPLLTTPRMVVIQNCPATPAIVGGLLTYTGSVSNSGNITLTNVVVTNDRSGATHVFTAATLVPGATANFTGSYTVPAGTGCSINSTMTASANDQCTGSNIIATSTVTCAVLGNSRIAVTLACPVTATPLGGVLTFSGTVSNMGNTTLTNVTVTRDAPGPNTVVFTQATLAPGASAAFSGSYTVPAINACSSLTAVTARAGDQCGSSNVVATTSINCPLVTTPRVSITQLCPINPGLPGGLLLYSVTVSNSGNINLTNVTVTSNDPLPNTVVFIATLLAPGASTNFTTSVRAAADACTATSTLAVRGSDQCNGVLATSSVATTCALITSPQLAVTKTCPAQPVIEGGLLTFTGTVTNTGNITLTNVFVVNSRPTANTAVIGPITLAPGAGTTFTGSYTAPLNTCSITDTLTATGRDKCTGTTVSNSVTATCAIRTIPAIAVTLTCPITPTVPGGLITFNGTVRNSGNVTLNNVRVVNNQPAPNTVVFTVASLAPGVSANFTASFTTPLDVCVVSSTVIATGADACSAVVVSNTASATCALATTPRIVVTQSCPTIPASGGGLLTYSGTVSNAGNITLTNVSVTNDRTGATPVFTALTLAPGTTANFTGSYTVPLGSGCSISSTVTARGGDKCTGSNVTATATATCQVATAPAIRVTLACPLVAPPLGGILTYSGTVSNSGNVTLSNVVVLNNRTGTNPVFTATFMAPGQTANFTGTYQVPVDCCTVSSTVTATGRDCNGIIARDTASSTCPVLTSPRLVVTKVCSAIAVGAGDLLRYSGTVSNAGNITLFNVTVVNNQPSNGAPVFGPVILAPGESLEYASSYILPADSCGTDTLTGRGTSICGDPVVATLTTTCPVNTSPRITVTKNCPVQPVPRGGLFVFTGTVRNSGNVTLTNVFVVNNQPAANTPVIGPITLAPGASANFTGSYTAPTCCCVVTDTLTARGQDRCTGSNVVSTATAVCQLLTTPAIAVDQTCPPASQPIGSVYQYFGSITNTGDINLTNVVVYGGPLNNILLLGPMELAPGESEGFTGSYTIGATMASNTVTASGIDICQARTITARASCTVLLAIGPAGAPATSYSNGTFRLSFATESGKSYTVQYKNALGDAWTNLQTVSGTGGYVTITDVTGGRPARFYRVISP